MKKDLLKFLMKLRRLSETEEGLKERRELAEELSDLLFDKNLGEDPLLMPFRHLVIMIRDGSFSEDIKTATYHLVRTKDDRAEKNVSDKFNFIWVCNPKVASRSIIDALRSITY